MAENEHLTGANHLGLEIVDVRALAAEVLSKQKGEKTRSAFDGAHYNIELDHERLTKQLNNVEVFMQDYKWHTVQEVAEALCITENSASAQIRNLRTLKYGAHRVDTVRTTPEGLFAYRLCPPQEPFDFSKHLRDQARKYGIKGIYE